MESKDLIYERYLGESTMNYNELNNRTAGKRSKRERNC